MVAETVEADSGGHRTGRAGDREVRPAAGQRWHLRIEAQDSLRLAIAYGNLLKSMPFTWNPSLSGICMTRRNKWLWYVNIGLDLGYRVFKASYFISVWSQLKTFHVVVHLYVLSASVLMYCFIINNLLKLEEVIATANQILKIEAGLDGKH